MKKIFIFFLILITINTFGQNVAINESGNTPNNNAILDINSDVNHNKGVLLPRMTTAERTALSLGLTDDGLTVYDTDTHSYWYWDGSQWIKSGNTSGHGTPTQVAFWSSSNTLSGSNNLYWDNTNGRLGIGTTTPREALEINGNVRGNEEGGALKIKTSYGYLDIGPRNNYFCHFITNKDKFYFNKKIEVNTGQIASYNTNNLYLMTNEYFRMTILNSNGYVGIATTTPQARLDIRGRTRIISSHSPSLYIENNSNQTSQYAILFRGQGSDRFKLASNGNAYFYQNVYIARSMPPIGLLDLNGHIMIRGGSPATNKILVSTNANGYAEWQTLNSIGGVTGAGTANRVAFWSGTRTLSSNANLYWDNFNGRLGIGTSLPGRRLDVNGHIRLSGGDRIIEISNGFLDIRPHDTQYGLILRDYNGDPTIWASIRTVNAPTDYLHISMNSISTNEGIIISDNGNVGIGTVSPTRKLEVKGTSGEQLIVNSSYGNDAVIGAHNGQGRQQLIGVYRGWDNRSINIGGYNAFNNSSYFANKVICGGANGYLPIYATAFNYISDDRQKKNITPINYGLDEIMKIQPVSYYYNWSDKKQIGFIANDVKKIIPEVVSTYNEDNTEFYAMDYAQMTTILIKAVQEQQKIIQEQQIQIDELRKKINNLENK